MPVFLRVTIALWASLAVALCLVVALNLLKFDDTLRQIAEARTKIILSGPGHAAARAYDFGLSLSAFPGLEDVVARAQRSDPALEDILLLDRDGIILRASEESLLGIRVPPSWRPAQSEEESWSLRTDGKLLVGRRLHSSFGVEIGGLLAVLSQEARHPALQAALVRWPAKAVAILIIACLLALPGTWHLSRRLHLFVQRLSEERVATQTGPTRPLDLPNASAAPGRPGVAEASAEAVLSRLRWSITLFALALMLLATASLTIITYHGFDQQLDQSLEIKGRVLGKTLAAELEQAAGHGIPLALIPDLRAFLEEARSEHPEVLYLGLFLQDDLIASSGSANSEALRLIQETTKRHISGSAPAESFGIGTAELNIVLQPVMVGSESLAVLAVGLDEHFAWRQLEDSFYDILTVLLVALIVAFEIVALLLMRPLMGPLQQLVWASREGIAAPDKRRFALYRTGQRRTSFGRQGDRKRRNLYPASALDARLPLFLCVFAEEMQKPFLPLYARSLTPRDGWISPEVLMGLPISVFMLMVALATLGAGGLVDRLGPRRVFLVGVIPLGVGYLLTALAPDIWSLLAGRAITAVGYGAFTMAAQGYVAQVGPSQQRTQSISVFISTLMAASICGTATGGILAAELGYRTVFLISIMLALLGALAAWGLMAVPREGPRLGSRRPFDLRAMKQIFGNPGFLSVLFFAAIPGKVVLTGLLLFVLPLYASQQGASAAEIGRIILLYPLLIVLLGPWFSRLADRADMTLFCTFAGSLLSGLAMLLLSFWDGLTAVTLVAVLLGIAHALAISPQVVLATRACERESEEFGQTRVLGLLRTGERIGSVAGPLIMGTLIAWQGVSAALQVTGLMVALAACGLLLTRRGRGRCAPEKRPRTPSRSR